MCYPGSYLCGLLKLNLPKRLENGQKEKGAQVSMLVYSTHCLRATSAQCISHRLAYWYESNLAFQSFRESPRHRGVDMGRWKSANKYLSGQAPGIWTEHINQFFFFLDSANTYFIQKNTVAPHHSLTARLVGIFSSHYHPLQDFTCNPHSHHSELNSHTL